MRTCRPDVLLKLIHVEHCQTFRVKKGAGGAGIQHEWRRAQALAGLAPWLAELGYSEEALAVVREIRYEDVGSWWP